MQLTHFTDFGLRILIYLTGVPDGEVVTIKEISAQFNVPQNHLNKIANRLGKLGWVEATPGRNGGLRLNIEPASLLLGDILQTLEGHPALVDCEKPACALKGNCNLKRILDLGLRDFFAAMNQYSLADLTQSPTSDVIARMHFQPRSLSARPH
ncbi:Rrf2 family protein [Solimicrobium silvestre]|uniref:Rrf2 family protein n=2 Tax=Solimicrobium silvestre TaxID=2099400 RepID=A0A2S9GU16_9BURK|nr:Rrf2 family protein [Solimicrobium silvestre]